MSKSRTCFASSVCCGDEFCELPESARLLYYQLGFEADTIGEIHGASRIAKGYGFNDADLQSLIDAGFIVEADGRRFIRHTFVNNSLPNEGMKQAAANAFEDVAEMLEFEGHPFKSAYRLIDADSPNVRLTLATNTIQTKSTQGNESVTESQIQEESKGTRHAKNAQYAHDSPPCTDSAPCPQCLNHCAVSLESNLIHGWCKQHGDFFIDAIHGGYVENFT